MRKRKNRRQEIISNKGITLIALVITIIVLLILAGISIASLTGENGILTQARNAKEQTEIDNEKEQVEIAASTLLIKYKGKSITQSNLQKQLDSNMGENTTTVYDNEDTLLVQIISSNRYYEVDKDGNISGPIYRQEIEYAGDITKNGKYDGASIETAYRIECIEDLVAFSAMTNGGYQDVNISIPTNQFYDKYVILMQNLDFNSELSYKDSTTTVYNGYLGIQDDNIGLRTALTDTKYIGFIPIGRDNSKYFHGIFDGNNYKIKNIYVSTTSNPAGLFGSLGTATIKNLSISGNITSSEYEAGGIVRSWPRSC